MTIKTVEINFENHEVICRSGSNVKEIDERLNELHAYNRDLSYDRLLEKTYHIFTFFERDMEEKRKRYKKTYKDGYWAGINISDDLDERIEALKAYSKAIGKQPKSKRIRRLNTVD